MQKLLDRLKKNGGEVAYGVWKKLSDFSGNTDDITLKLGKG